MFLASEFIVRQTATRNLRHDLLKAASVVKVFAVVISEYLLIKIAVKMERLDRNIGSMQPALQQAPKVFKSIRVDLPLHIGDRMVDDLMRVLPFQSFVGKQLIRIESRPCFDSLL